MLLRPIGLRFAQQSESSAVLAGAGPGGGARGGGGTVPVPPGGWRPQAHRLGARTRPRRRGRGQALRPSWRSSWPRKKKGRAAGGASINAELLRAGLARRGGAPGPGERLFSWRPLWCLHGLLQINASVRRSSLMQRQNASWNNPHYDAPFHIGCGWQGGHAGGPEGGRRNCAEGACGAVDPRRPG